MEKENCLTWGLFANRVVGGGAWCRLPRVVHIYIHTAIVAFWLILAPFGVGKKPVVNPLVATPCLKIIIIIVLF